MGDVVEMAAAAKKYGLAELPSRELVQVPPEPEPLWRRVCERILDWVAYSLFWCIVVAIILIMFAAAGGALAWSLYVGAEILVRNGHGWLVYSPILIGVGWWVGRSGKKRDAPVRPKSTMYELRVVSESPHPPNAA